MPRSKSMPPEEIFSRTLFGVLMIGSTFVSWGKWLVLALGILFLISASQGFCWTCFIYKKFSRKP